MRTETVWEGANGVEGFVEHRLAPRMLGNLYVEELVLLDRCARDQPGTGAATAAPAREAVASSGLEES